MKSITQVLSKSRTSILAVRGPKKKKAAGEMALQSTDIVNIWKTR